MTVTDEHEAALRAYLALDLEEFERLSRKFAQTGDVVGYGHLIYAAFTEAIRRRFSPTWTHADVIRLVASVRKQAPQAQDIDPRAAEVLIRRALGDSVAYPADEATSGIVQLIVLGRLVADEHADGAALDEFLAASRKLADSLLK